MSQKIEYIAVKNFKGIKELEVSNLSRFVAVFGKNGAGKTSFIEAIKSAIKADKWVNSKVRIELVEKWVGYDKSIDEQSDECIDYVYGLMQKS